MIRSPRPAALATLVAALILAPAAGAQQQQGAHRAADYATRARDLVAKKRYRSALSLLDSLARAEPGSREAVVGRGQVLALLGRLADAIRAYERWVAAHPNDVEVVELLARALSWAGRLDDAERVYKVLAALGSPEAERGLARIAAWRGDLAESERWWRAIVARRPADAEAWIGLAQVLRWTGRNREARVALKRALASDPANRDAAEQLRWVEAALAPHVDPSVATMRDNEGNHVTTLGAALAVAAPWDGELSLRVHRRDGTLGVSRASSVGAVASASRTAARVTLRGSLGAARLDDPSAAPDVATRDLLTAGASVWATPSSRLRLGAVAAREPFDETVGIIRRGIVTTTLGAGAALDISRRLGLAAEVEQARLAGATPNTRTGGAASLRWRAPLALSLGSTVRAFGYASDPLEGYFAPRRYLLAEGSARLAVGRDLGWGLTVDGGIGAQSIDSYTAGSETQPAARGALSIRYRPTPGLEWDLSGHLATAASAATSTLTGYRASGWRLGGRMSF